MGKYTTKTTVTTASVSAPRVSARAVEQGVH